MNCKAFFFDMDGVLVDSEHMWGVNEPLLLKELVGEENFGKLNRFPGMSIKDTFTQARALGVDIDWPTFIAAYHRLAPKAYKEMELTPGVNELGSFLATQDYKLGIVSSSPRAWIDMVMERLTFADKIECIVSAMDDEGIRPKPEPDAYVIALQKLNADPAISFALEDSSTGIRAGRAAGVRVIGFRGNVVDGHEPEGAEVYVDTMQDVERIVST